ncbi:MAG: SCO family protein [Opitutales bacterium]
MQLAARTIEAEVLSVDASSYKAELRELGNIPEKTLTARMSPGDIALNWSGQRIRGELVGGEAAFMERIWPADPLKIKQAEGINRQLRRNTVERGRRVFRTNGEYMPPFALYNQSGALITHEHLKGKYTVLNFIFTRCQVATMCPAATTRMVRLQNDLADAGLEEKVRQVTITFDPQYDTPGILRGYGDARGIDPARFHLLTGDPQAIRDLCAQFGVQVKDVNKTLDHTMSTVLLDPNNKIRYRKTGSRWRSEDFLEFIQAMEN